MDSSMPEKGPVSFAVGVNVIDSSSFCASVRQKCKTKQIKSDWESRHGLSLVSGFTLLLTFLGGNE